MGRCPKSRRRRQGNYPEKSSSGSATFAAGASAADKINFGVSATYPPFESLDASNQIVGFDIDLWDAIASDLKLEYKLQPMDFNGILPALRTSVAGAAPGRQADPVPALFVPEVADPEGPAVNDRLALIAALIATAGWLVGIGVLAGWIAHILAVGR